MEKDDFDTTEENTIEEDLKNLKIEIENKCEGTIIFIRYIIF
jgi:hypothetical protein